MKVSKKSMMLAAAFSGLLAGTVSRADTGVPNGNSNPPLKPSSSFAGQAAGSTVAADTDKHACQGKNSCKGKGGCKAGDNGCKGKNTCKGKGGCATDGSKKPGLVA
jgi:hypothetical protein